MAIVALSFLGFTIIAAVAIVELRATLMDDRHERIQSLVEAATGLVDRFHQRVVDGEMTDAEAQAAAMDALRGMRYGEDGYVFIFDSNAVTLMHAVQPALEGRNLLDLQDGDGVRFVRDLIAAAHDGGGFVAYQWPKVADGQPIDKLSYAALFAPWDWTIGTGIYMDEVGAHLWAHVLTFGGLVLVVLLVVGALSLVIGRSISRPVKAITRAMLRLADGDTTATTGIATGGEIGEMASALEVFRENALRVASLHAEQDALTLAREDDRRTMQMRMLRDFVKVSVEGNEAAIRMAQMRQSLLDTDREVQTMASAVEELSAAISEISTNGDQASLDARTSEEAAQHGVEKAEEASRSMDSITSTVSTAKSAVTQLGDASAEIGEIIKQIEEIASQTNLLALNATIEAARAGEAGKGFAVVAAEVKALANQTAKATDDIRSRIGNVQGRIATIVDAMDESTHTVETGREVVAGVGSELGSIATSVNAVAGKMVTIASILTEQSSATTELARSASTVADIATRNTEEAGNVIEAIYALTECMTSRFDEFTELGPLAVIEIAKYDHVMFRKRIVDAVLGHNDLTADGVPDHHACRLGKWYDQADALVRAQPAYARLAEPHRRVHDAGKHVLALLRQGHVDEASVALEPLAQASHGVIALLDELGVQTTAAMGRQRDRAA
ncbi:MAG: cache domain-containing protein [Rhodospirillaceae bacterium]|nr:cache domain-containing protein [Rhodospirillaceae bacterium]